MEFALRKQTVGPYAKSFHYEKANIKMKELKSELIYYKKDDIIFFMCFFKFLF